MALSAYERALRLLGQRQHFRGDLRRKLVAKGYEAAEVDAALAEVDPEEDLARARAAAAKWRRSRRAAPGSRSPSGEDDALRRRAENAALARHLERKGFGRRAIVAILAEAGASSDVELDEA